MTRTQRTSKVRFGKEVDYINHEIGEYQKSSVEVANQANETLRLLSGQLILIAGTMLTISAAFITDNLRSSPELESLKWLLAVSWIVLGSSMFLGIVDIIMTSKLFSAWSKYHYGIAAELGTGKYTSRNINKAKEKNKRPRNKSPQWPLYVQISLLGVGTLGFVIVIIGFLFSPA